MTTPESVLLTQIPIALGIFWLAWELRQVRRSLERDFGPGEAAADARRSGERPPAGAADPTPAATGGAAGRPDEGQPGARP
jgi:hypothetical protein